MGLNYLGICFMLLTFERGMSFSSSLHHFILILIVVFFVIFRFSGITKIAAKKQAAINAKKLGTTAAATGIKAGAGSAEIKTDLKTTKQE
jgi:hypothetical protein